MDCKDKLTQFRTFLMMNSSGISDHIREAMLLHLQSIEQGDDLASQEMIENASDTAGYLAAMLHIELAAAKFKDDPMVMARYLENWDSETLGIALAKSSTAACMNAMHGLAKVGTPEARKAMLALVTASKAPVILSSRVEIASSMIGTEMFSEQQFYDHLKAWIKEDGPPLTSVYILYSHKFAPEPLGNYLTRMALKQYPFEEVKPISAVGSMVENRFASLPSQAVVVMTQRLAESGPAEQITDPSLLRAWTLAGSEFGFGGEVVRRQFYEQLWAVAERSEDELLYVSSQEPNKYPRYLAGMLEMGLFLYKTTNDEKYRQALSKYLILSDALSEAKLYNDLNSLMQEARAVLSSYSL